MGNLLKDKKAISVFMLPGSLLYLIVVLVPVGWSLVYTLFEGVPGLRFEFVGLAGYRKIFSDPQFWRSFQLTLKYTVIVTGFQILIGLLLAFFFVYGLKRFQTTVRTIVFLPVVLPIVAVGQLFSKIYAIAPSYGLLNSFLSGIGLDNLVKAWIGLPQTALPALCVQDIWMTAGFYAVIFYAGLLDVPANLLEAAKIDGASGWKRARYITLPLLRPILGTAIIYSLSSTLKVFSSVLALTNGGPARSTYMLSLYMYDTAFQFNQYGYGSVIGVFIMLECLCIVMITNFAVNRKKID
ncbi:MAG: sugar ABC transporter permease [Eubacteriales bacterium]|nr:sugar ABC transporter permease [Eubacteriales bacterium]